MKTKVRISKSSPELNSIDGNKYQHLFIDFLVPMYQGDDYLEVAFTLRWLASSTINQWFGMEFSCSTNKLKHIEYMTKVARAIDRANLGNNEETPQTILHTLNATKYVSHTGDFIPESLNGCNYYHLTKNGEIWCGIHAISESEARKKAKKKMKSFRNTNLNWDLEKVEEDIQLNIVSMEIDVPQPKEILE